MTQYVANGSHRAGRRFAKAVTGFVALVFLFAVVLAALVLAGFFLHDRISQRAEQTRQAEYPRIVASYSEALKPGANRYAVESYIRSRKEGFEQMCCVGARQEAWADLIKLGERTSPVAKWPCTRVNVYAAFEFEPDQPRTHIQAADSDKLVGVSLFEQPQPCL